MKFFFGSILVLLLPPFLMAQAQRVRPRDQIVDVQVMIGYDDGRSLGATPVGMADAGNKNESRISGGTRHSDDFGSRLQIRAQLQNSDGTTIAEQSPNGEGKVLFRVRAGGNYRLRVFGADIEEKWVEQISPLAGDRLIAVEVHRKGSPAAVQSSPNATIAANRLNIPAKARDALEGGNRALSAGDLKKAKRSFEKAIRIYPKYDVAYNNLGVVLMQTGDAVGGQAAFQKALELNDRFPRAYMNMAQIAISGQDFAHADSLVRKALAGDPLNPHLLFLAAEASFFNHQYAQTVTDVALLHSLPHVQYGLAHYLAAKALEMQNKPAAAKLEYKLLLDEEPSSKFASQARAALEATGTNQ